MRITSSHPSRPRHFYNPYQAACLGPSFEAGVYQMQICLGLEECDAACAEHRRSGMQVLATQVLNYRLGDA